MPYVIGKSEKQKKLLDRLDKEFVACARRYNLPLGDFPNVERYRRMLREIKDISDFKKLDKNLVYEMDKVLTHDIPKLLQRATRPSPKIQEQKQSLQQQHVNANSYYNSLYNEKEQQKHNHYHPQYNQQYYDNHGE